MSEVENTSVIRRYTEEIRKGNLSVIDELFSPYFRSNDEVHTPSDLEQLKRNTAEGVYAIEYNHRSTTYSAKGDLVTTHDESTFRLVKPYLDGKVFDSKWRTIKSYSVWRVSGGKIVEYVEGDTLSFFEH